MPRSVSWGERAQEDFRRLPRRLQDLVLDLIASLAVAPLPPAGALPDPEILNAYEIFLPEITLKFTIYEEAVYIWIIRRG